MIVLYVALALILLILFMITPSLKKRAKPWRGTLFAHRGLHGNGIAENTLAAFGRAVDNGFGIELDVQLSRDGVVVVFHDDDLKRMTGDARRVDEVDLAELKEFDLGGEGRIPTFSEVLELVNGKVPLLVEIKSGKRNSELCEKTMALLNPYAGRYVLESFNPLVLKWMRKNAPQVIRGQLVGAIPSYIEADHGRLTAFILSALSLNFLSRPDFIAYDVMAKRFPAPRIQRALYKITMAAWTVRDIETCRECLARGEMPIFEGFMPDK